MEPGSKKSIAVPLVLMGAVAGSFALPALFGGTDVQRNKYNSRQACVEDYSEDQCKQDVPFNGAPGAFLFYGPWYRSDYRSRVNDPNDAGPGKFYRGGASGFSSAGSTTGAPAAIESGTRGGFGSSGRVSARGS